MGMSVLRGYEWKLFGLQLQLPFINFNNESQAFWKAIGKRNKPEGFSPAGMFTVTAVAL